MNIPFTKVVAAGNAFVLVDDRARRLVALKDQWPAISRAFCERRRGPGVDGLLVLEPSRRADARMRIFNPDGSEAEMCGNGARCVAAYLSQGNGERGTGRGRGKGRAVTIETRAGMISVRVRGRRVAVAMTEPSELRPDLTLTVAGQPVHLASVNTGVPHAVVPVRAVELVDVSRLGRALRRHRHFAPEGTNVNFVQTDPGRADRLSVRTYERGVERETLACGTGAAASAVIHAVHQWMRGTGSGPASTHRIEVETRGGEVLTVGMSILSGRGGACVTDVTLEGPAERVFEGECEWPAKQAKRLPAAARTGGGMRRV